METESMSQFLLGLTADDEDGPLAQALLHYGRPYMPQAKQKNVKLGAYMECYRNAIEFILAMQRRSPVNYAYCEGYASVSDGDTGLHAWVVGPDDLVIDPTPAPSGVWEEYYGIPMNWEYVRKVLVEMQKHDSVLLAAISRGELELALEPGL